jgi:hypothetical protein
MDGTLPKIAIAVLVTSLENDVSRFVRAVFATHPFRFLTFSKAIT